MHRQSTNHGHAAVVDLGEEALLLVGRAHVAEAEAERVVEVEQDLLEGSALTCVDVTILRRVRADAAVQWLISAQALYP